MANTPQATSNVAAKPASGSALGLVLTLLLVTVCAAGVGMGLVWLIKPKADSAGKHDSQRSSHSGSANRGIQLLELPSIIGQVGSDRKIWVRLDVSVLVASEAPLTPNDAATLADDFLSFVQTLSLEDLSSSSRLRILREDLEERARIRARSKSAQVVFRSMVIE